MRYLSRIYLLLTLSFLGCDKKQEPAPEPAPQSKKVSFTFRLDPQPEGVTAWELVVSQKDGKVLLDTLLAPGIQHALEVKSEDTKFDVTTLYRNPDTKAYEVRTYLQVNPDQWHKKENLSQSVFGQTEPATIHYANAPSFTDMQFASKQSYGGSATYDGNEIVLKYDRLLPTDLTYLLLPASGQYLFAETKAPITRVDFAKAGTAVKRQYPKPAGTINYSFILYGYTTAGDYSQTLLLYLAGPRPDYDLQFPPTVIEEFQLTALYKDATGHQHSYINRGPTIPTEMPFVGNADYTVTQAAANNFQIKFSDTKPTTYTMVWVAKDLPVTWHVMAPPEETEFKLQDFLQKMKPQLLAGESGANFSLTRLTSTSAPGYTHQTWHDYHHNPAAFLRRDLKQYREIARSF